MIVTITLFIRLVLYPVAAYAFFVLATLYPRWMRSTCYALSIFFLVATWKAVTTFHHLNSIYVDVTLMPTLALIVILAYASVLHLSSAAGLRPDAGSQSVQHVKYF